MQFVLIGIGILAIVMFGAPAFARASPARLASLLRFAAGGVLAMLALLLLARGQLHLAVILLGVGLPLIFGSGGRLFGSKPKTVGQTSEVATSYLRVRLDHDSGDMQGEVLAGHLSGRALSSLGSAELLGLLVECREQDPRSLPLIEAYLDHRFPDWRDAAANESPGASPESSKPMTPAEARQILGIGPDASEEQIRAAWRELMKRNHPDQGGSGYLAAKINEAKDVLLGKP